MKEENVVGGVESYLNERSGWIVVVAHFWGACISSSSSTSELCLTQVHFPDGQEQLAPQEQVHPGAVVWSAAGLERVDTWNTHDGECVEAEACLYGIVKRLLKC